MVDLADDAFNWQSSNPPVATLPSKVLHTVAVGSATGSTEVTVQNTHPAPRCPQITYGPTQPVSVNSQKPTSLKVLSASVVPITSLPKCVLTDYGIAVAIHYQVLDQNGVPIQSDGLVPQEEVLNVSINGSKPVNLEPDWGNIGPNLGMPSQFTDASGTFWDDPYGVCTSFAFTETSQQPISILLSGINFPVRTNNWTVTSTAPGHGTISNGSDVKQSQ